MASEFEHLSNSHTRMRYDHGYCTGADYGEKVIDVALAELKALRYVGRCQMFLVMVLSTLLVHQGTT